MGNNSVKETKGELFSPEELTALKNSYKSINGNFDTLTQEKLLTKWNSLIDPELLKYTVNHLFGRSNTRVATITFKEFSQLFYTVNRGTIDEKVNLIRDSLAEADNADELVLKDIETYVNTVLKSYLNILRQDSAPDYSSWNKNCYQTGENSIHLWTQNLTKTLGEENSEKIELHKLEKWLQVNPTFLTIWSKVFTFLFEQNQSRNVLSSNSSQILPICDGIPPNQNYAPIVELSHVMYLNSLLPNEFRQKWRFLFSSKIHGESFSTMLGKILNKSPTIFIIEDENGYIFGGYATAKWALGPKFVGDDTSMLFTLNPAFRVYPATSYNNHYQYLNLNQQTMPNGLGMGGQFDFWGLWLDCEYGIGHSSESCTTYRDYCQLSAEKNFKIKNIEVWAVGEEPRQDDDDDDETPKFDGKKSILDKHLEDKVMLELSGQVLHSEGLRDPDLAI